MRVSRLIKFLFIVIVFIALSGCATIPYRPPSIPEHIAGIYHEVQRGETLWRISKAYETDMKEIVRLNKLPDASRINSGQLIFIPYAKRSISTTDLYSKEDNFIWPIQGEIVSSFGSFKDGVKNKGLDIAAKEGGNIIASRSGKVRFCDNKVKGLGKTVIIDHGDGYSTIYAHNSKILVTVGDYIKQGKVIAKAGNTGRAKVTSLHFEIRKEHIPENPFYYLP